MGTISDKLMRIINTKEDIRQALISKGYDVPTSIPFKEYAKMILDLPCNADSFPDIEGIVARYSALGLTNEQMAENPVWKDLTGNGHDLQMKNFAWGRMSGVGGYVDNWNSSADWAINSYWVNSHTDHKLQFIKAGTAVQMKSNNIYNAENVYKNILNVNGLTEAVNKGSVKALRINAVDPITSKAIKTFSFDIDGVIQISFDDVLQDYYVVYFLAGNNTNDIDITIEQLPLYPGFILGDGVDDEAATENLDLEDTYTVYTPLILLKYGGVVSGKSSAKDFSLNTVVSSKSIGFDSANAWSGSIPVDLFEFALVVCKRDPKTMYVKDLITGKANQSNSKEFVPNPGKYFIWRNTGGSWCQVAIAGQIICNGHFSTDEEDAKVLAWHKKQYPWLFPDQAWTVTGKTNEDEDRATIANITGNGNDLVLSNFGFAEGSGYGLYQQNYAIWNKVSNRATFTVTSSKIHVTSVTAEEHADFIYTTGQQLKQKIRITGLPEGASFVIGRSGVNLKIISQDGIYDVDILDDSSANPIIGYRINRIIDSCDITIEQIPEYEGYLVTDGVDDKITSSAFKMGKDWTVVGDWKFINDESKNAGIIKPSSLYVYNALNGVSIFINSGSIGNNIKENKGFNAICSDGRAYDRNWTEYSELKVEEVTKSNSELKIGASSNDTNYTRMAFKNFAIYPKVLSKDDCIKAYNYLQTLKSK